MSCAASKNSCSRSTTHDIVVHTLPDTALYLLNHKRASIVDYENRFGVSIIIEADGWVGAQHFAIERGEAVENPVKIETSSTSRLPRKTKTISSSSG